MSCVLVGRSAICQSDFLKIGQKEEFKKFLIKGRIEKKRGWFNKGGYIKLT